MEPREDGGDLLCGLLAGPGYFGRVSLADRLPVLALVGWAWLALCCPVLSTTV